jgi:hypothetical protein
MLCVVIGMAGGLVALLGEQLYMRWRIKHLAKDGFKSLTKEETAEARAAREDGETRREFIQSQLDEVLDEHVKDPAGTGKLLDYAASYLRARARTYKERDRRMLERIERICRAGSAHLGNLAPPERISVKWEKDQKEPEPIHGC